MGLVDLPSPAGVTVTPKKAMGLTAFWAGVRMISQTIASLPLQVYEKTGQGRRPAPEHHIDRLLHVRPNPFMTPFTFKEIRAAHVLTWGNSYAEIEYDGAGRPVALWPLLPDRTDVEIRNGEKRYWTIINGEKIWLASDRVLHVPGLGFDGLKGYNVIKVHRDSLGLSAAANEYGAQFFGNSGRPSGYLTTNSKLDQPQVDRIREQWNQLHQGLTRAQRTAVLWGGMEFKQVSVPPEDAQFLETRAFQIEEVARILNINPILLQHFEKATTWGTGVAQFLIAFGKFTIIPWLEREEDVLNYDLFTESERGRYFVKYNVDALLRGDHETQAKVLEIERRNGVINADEWRALKDENPLPDGLGRIYTVPLNVMNLAHLAREPVDSGDRANRSVNKRARQERSLTMRRRLKEAHLPAFEDGARRFVRRDVQALERAIKRAFAEADPISVLNRWIDEFYPGQREQIYRTMLPLVMALSRAIAAEAFDEVDAEPVDVTSFAESYTDNLASREVDSSIGQIRSLMDEKPLEELEEALTTRAAEWNEKRPGKVAANEVVRVAAGAARFAWQTAGVRNLVWRASGDSCPLCQSMDGRKVGVTEYFLQPGDTVDPGGGATPLVSEYHIAGPPLHGGCDCDIVPE